MKTCQSPKGLHITGKAYEVRWLLRSLIQQAPDPHAPLQYSLTDRLPTGKQSVTARIIPFPVKVE
jgi:hypothetical protein